MAMEWWRCKHGAPFDPKWISIATRCNDDATQGNAHFVAGTIRPGDVWCVFTALCDRASKSDERGSLEGLDLEDIASGLGFGLEEVEVVFNALKAKGIICDNKITTWDRHQPKREDDRSTERSRKHREKVRDAMQHTATQGDARLDKTRLEKTREERKEDSATQTKEVSSVESENLSPLDFKKELWRRGVSFLKKNGLKEPDARAMLGKWRKDHSDIEVLNALAASEGSAASEPIAYVTAVLNGRKANGRNGKSELSDHPLGIFGEIGDELRELSERGR